MFVPIDSLIVIGLQDNQRSDVVKCPSLESEVVSSPPGRVAFYYYF